MISNVENISGTKKFLQLALLPMMKKTNDDIAENGTQKSLPSRKCYVENEANRYLGVSQPSGYSQYNDPALSIPVVKNTLAACTMNGEFDAINAERKLFENASQEELESMRKFAQQITASIEAEQTKRASQNKYINQPKSVSFDPKELEKITSKF